MMAGQEITLMYEGTDITADVDIVECVHRDICCGGSDCLTLKLDHAEKWMKWEPQKNDRLRVMRSGYDSGELFLNTVIPEDGAYRILATGTKSVPFAEKWKAYREKTLAAVMAECAAECGMKASQSGISGGLRYEYLLRENVSAAVFMEMLLHREGAVLKAFDGKFAAIGVEYAQGLPAMHEMELEAQQLESMYIDRRDMRWASVKIQTPFGKGAAADSATDGQERIITDIPVDSDAHAKRWAKGLLMMHNRMSEQLQVEMDFNPGYTAMVRIDVKSDGDAAGKWMVHEAEQDMLDGRTRAKLVRCIETIS